MEDTIDYVYTIRLRVQPCTSSSLRVNLSPRNGGRWLRTLFKHPAFRVADAPTAVEGYGSMYSALRPRQYAVYGVRKYRNDVFITGLLFFRTAFRVVLEILWDRSAA